MEFSSAFPADGKTLELMEQGEGLFHDVTELAQALDVRGAPARVGRQDPALAQLLAAGGWSRSPCRRAANPGGGVAGRDARPPHVTRAALAPTLQQAAAVARRKALRTVPFESRPRSSDEVKVPLVSASGVLPKNQAAGNHAASGYWAGEQRHG